MGSRQFHFFQNDVVYAHHGLVLWEWEHQDTIQTAEGNGDQEKRGEVQAIKDESVDVRGSDCSKASRGMAASCSERLVDCGKYP